MAEPLLLSRTEGRVRTLTLNRPKTRNALTFAMTEDLARELWAAENDDSVAVVILTGTDPAFCSGLDLSEYGEGRFDIDIMIDPRRSPWKVLRSMATPVIGAVNGPAVIAGLELALACSFLVASEQARFADTYVRLLHTYPGGGLTGLLPQAVGVRRAREMSFTGAFMDVVEAYERGLVNHVVPHDQLLAVTASLAADIVTNDRTGVRRINQMYQQATGTTLSQAIAIEERSFHRAMDTKAVAQRWRNRIWDAPIMRKR